MWSPEDSVGVFGKIFIEAATIGAISLFGLAAHTEIHRAETAASVAVRGHEQRQADLELAGAELLAIADIGAIYFFGRIGGFSIGKPDEQ